MPTYEYRCEQGHAFERIQKMSDKPLTRCPVCGAKASRIISGGQGLIFKGTGFYITDYGKDGKGPRKDSDAATGGEAKVAAKSEGKPDAKAGSGSGGASETPAGPKGDAKRDTKPVDGAKSGKPDAS